MTEGAFLGKHYLASSSSDDDTSISSPPEISPFRHTTLFEEVKVSNVNHLVSRPPEIQDSDSPEEFVNGIRSAISNASIDENTMNLMIQSQLNKHFGEHHFGELEEEVLRTGRSLVNVQSTPDFIATNASRTPSPDKIIFGKGKNKTPYSLQDAVHQVAAYMLTCLCWQVAVRGTAATCVYGIAIAGCKCRGMKKTDYAVVLQGLSLPMKVGGRLVLKQFRTKALDDVWHFLQRALHSNDNEDGCKIGKGSPGLLQVPREAMLKPLPDGLELVPNGTGNLVFRVSNVKGMVFLESRIDFLRGKKPDWSIHVKDERITFPFYVKVKNYLASSKPHGCVSLSQRFLAESLDLTTAYKTPETFGEFCSVLLVNDLGSTVRDERCPARDLDMLELTAQYSEFMVRVAAFEAENGLYHGDMHRGNITYHTEYSRFMLIDYDEASVNMITPRGSTDGGHQRRYPQTLLEYPQSYGQHQLMMAYEDIIDDYFRMRPKNSEPIFAFFDRYPVPERLDAESVGLAFQELQKLMKKYCDAAGFNPVASKKLARNRKRRAQGVQARARPDTHLGAVQHQTEQRETGK